MLISGLIGTSLGLCAGYFGGRVDMAITFVITARLSMPIALIALAGARPRKAASPRAVSLWPAAYNDVDLGPMP